MAQPLSAGAPRIDFRSHLVRAGDGGARDDFETMLCQLLDAVEGDAHVVQANPGDWGIDVLIGELDKTVRIWQAKFHINGIGKSQQGQIRESFASAIAHASKHGHTIEKWTLCVPVDMDPPTLKWWQGWKRDQTKATGVPIDLLSATKLAALLHQPQAAHVRRAYFDPFRGDDTPGPGVVTVVHQPPRTDGEWTGGELVGLGTERYLLHDGASESRDPAGRWVWREARADRGEPSPAPSWLRQLDAFTETAEVPLLRDGLRRQHAVATGHAASPSLPRCRIEAHGTTITLVHDHPAGRTWREFFGTAGGSGDSWATAAMLTGASRIGQDLTRLHRAGVIHADIGPDTMRVLTASGRVVLRDLGYAGLPGSFRPRVGEYPLPELSRVSRAGLGPWSDVYLVAALTYHTLTGSRPSMVNTPPVRAWIPGFGETLDALITRALNRDPVHRPKLCDLTAELDTEKQRWEREGTG